MKTIDEVTIDKFHNKGRLHKFSINKSITMKEAIKLQTKLGYHPSGYGFQQFDATLTKTTWICRSSCD